MAATSFCLVAFAALVVALALAQEQKPDSKHFVLHIWRNKQQCQDKPDIPLMLLNDINKCQVVLKDFFWAKGSCQGGKLQGQVCTDAQCMMCFDLQDVAPQNECTFNNLLQGAYKYTCEATEQNISKTKEAGPPSAEINRTIGEQVKEKIPEATGEKKDQGVAPSELVADQQRIKKIPHPPISRKDDLDNDNAVATQQTNQSEPQQENQEEKKQQGQDEQNPPEDQKKQQEDQKHKEPTRGGGGQTGGSAMISTTVALVLPIAAVLALF